FRSSFSFGGRKTICPFLGSRCFRLSLPFSTPICAGFLPCLQRSRSLRLPAGSLYDSERGHGPVSRQASPSLQPALCATTPHCRRSFSRLPRSSCGEVAPFSFSTALASCSLQCCR